MPWLDYVLKGVQCMQTKSGRGGRERLPITPAILHKLKEMWSESPAGPDTKLIWAACCLCFFVSLKAGEMTTLDEGGYDPSVHLSYKDIAIDDRWQPSLIRVSIRCMRILHYFFTTAPVNLQTLNTSVNSVQLSLWGTASLLEQGQSTILL